MYPTFGDIILIVTQSGVKYRCRVVSVLGSVVKVIFLDTTFELQYNKKSKQVLCGDDIYVLLYEDSLVDTYLNKEYFSSLGIEMQRAICSTDIKQDVWDVLYEESDEYNFINILPDDKESEQLLNKFENELTVKNRKMYIPSLSDIVLFQYDGYRDIVHGIDFLQLFFNTREFHENKILLNSGSADYPPEVIYFDCDTCSFLKGLFNDTYTVFPVALIDLSKINWEFQ